jgi:quinoprotein glucose dehydrogenase
MSLMGNFASASLVALGLISSSSLFVLSQGIQSSAISAQPAATDWPVYGGRTENDHYSSLIQIDRTNVSKLQVAWQFDTGEKGGLQASPIVIGRVLYGYTPSQKVIALDAATGKLLWKFDSGINGTQPARGVTYWSDGKESRLFAGVMNFLYALDPATGKPIESFGEHGRVDLRKDLRGDYQLQSIALTTPGVIYKDLIIVGGRNPETHPSPPGDIRAFDVHSGALRWSFHTIPRPGEFGYDTWPKDAWKYAGAANNWGGMTVDVKRGIVYAPTGSAVSDFYGGDRLGDDLFADTLLALDAETGRRIWHFQGVHHDVWDRDFPSPPSLVTVMHDGKRVDAVAQTTKQAYLYLFDRATGKPLFPIEDLKYPASNLPGEATSPLQPRPVKPAPFGRQAITEDTLTNRTPEAHAWALTQFKKMRSEGQFVPFSLDKLTIVFPGFDGGAEWGGSAVDVASGVLYVNENEMAWLGGLVESKKAVGVGESIYGNQCAVCHGGSRAGSPPAFPSLIDVDKRLTDSEILKTVEQGKGRMPAFPSVSDAQLQALLTYLKTPMGNAGHSANDKQEMAATSAGPEENAARRVASKGQGDGAATDTANGPSYKYQFAGYRKFLDPDGYPAISTPWGTLNAIDLNTGEFLWKIPFGEYPELAAKGRANSGSENYGGPIVTAGGVLFIGATVYDRKFHAYDSRSGALLWQTTLPFSGVATPATYTVDGKQYVVIACGGGRDPKSPSGGMYVAFALP